MPETVLQTIINEIIARVKTVRPAETVHLGFHAGDLPHQQVTAIGQPSQDRMNEAEHNTERFEVDIPISIKTVDENGENNQMSKMLMMYGELKLAIFGGDLEEIDFTLGGLVELVQEQSFSPEDIFEQGGRQVEADLTIRVQYSTLRGNPYEPVT